MTAPLSRKPRYFYPFTERPESEITVALRATATVLDSVDGKDYRLELLAHTVRRGANQMVKLEATIRKQNERLGQYRCVAVALKRLAGDI